MYTLIVVTVCISSKTQAVELWETTNFSAVTQFEDLADFYHTLLSQSEFNDFFYLSEFWEPRRCELVLSVTL